MAKWAVEIEFDLGRRVVKKMAFTHAGGADGLTNLYSSITAEPRIILSTIRDRNTAMIIRAMSAINPRIGGDEFKFSPSFGTLKKSFKTRFGRFSTEFHFGMLPLPLQL